MTYYFLGAACACAVAYLVRGAFIWMTGKVEEDLQREKRQESEGCPL